MRISTKGEYGIRAMLELALHYREGPMALGRIAERQAISEPYLEQLIAGLRKAGLVTSVRGAQGGYELTRDPEAIPIGEIIRALEGPITPMECLSEEPESLGCENSERCATRLLWRKLQASINEVLDTTTLGDLVADNKRLNQEEVMYYI